MIIIVTTQKKKNKKNKNKINVNLLYELTNKFVYECYKFNY